MENAFRKWGSGIAQERQFWSEYLKTRGGSWKDFFAFTIDPSTSLQGPFVKILQDIGQSRLQPSNHFRILDVGAGPLSSIGKTMPDATLEIVATDPLANIYDALLEQNQIVPVVRTQFAIAEDLSAFFSPSLFDMVHCSNALDHSMEPMRGIAEMLRVVKVNGTVFLSHTRNVAEHENYSGFHQYNFDIVNDRFVIWNKEMCITVEHTLPVACTVTNTLIENGEWIHTVITKREEFKDADDTHRRDERLRAVYQQMIGALESD